MAYATSQRPMRRDGGHEWALVLAGGEGSRLQALTRTATGISVPKQFCSMGAGSSLLHDALQRARTVVPPEHLCAIVAEHHRRWWQALPHSVSVDNLIVQPCSRGTANGILLPLLHILQCDPDASLLVLPSDHHVRHEEILAESLRRAMREVGRAQAQDGIVLLGIEPEDADPELGYIVSEPDTDQSGLRRVTAFAEKPSAASARTLIVRGGLWNAFILAAHGRTLLRAFEIHCSDAIAEMRHIVADSADPSLRQMRLTDLYQRLPELDFSRDILQSQAASLRVLRVPYCGWSDLGTPRRVAEAVRREEFARRDPSTVAAHARGFLDLAARHSQLQAAQ